MPELPEVEIIKLGLQKKIIGLKIQKIEVSSPKSFIGNPKLAMGQTVLKIWRRAKLLGVDLAPSKLGDSSLIAQNDQGVTLLFHMKMSGQLIYIPDNKPLTINHKRFIGGHPTPDMVGEMPNSHTRVIFTFSDPLRPRSEASKSHLYFNDQRKFGWIRVISKFEIRNSNFLTNLGPEPLEKDFTWQVLKQNLLRHKSMPIKVAIMDQSVVAGVGNIYSNEACFVAKIDPRRKVADLTDQEFKSLYQGIIKSLEAGIKYGGSTRVHFVDPEGPPATLGLAAIGFAKGKPAGVAMRAGHKGYFLDYAFVYWRDKHPCKICGTEIKKISLGGRGTYFCSTCQK